jgi:sugar phosphate permease
MQKENTVSKFGHFGKGWIMILYVFLAYFLTTAVGSSMNVAAIRLSEEYGWSRTLLTSLVSVASYANIIASFIVGAICVKKSAKKVSIVLGFIYAISVLALGFTSNLLAFALLMIIANSFSCAWGYQASPVLVSHWFPKKKGVVMGLVTIGIPLGAGMTSIIYNGAFDSLGIQWSFLPFAVLSIVALVILMTVLADHPEDVGYNPDNDKSMTREEAAKILAEEMKRDENSIWTTKKLLRTPQVWINSVTLGTQLLFASGLMVQIIPRLLELGYDMGTATKMLMFSSLCAIVGSYICGLIDAKFGARKAAASTFVVGILAMILNITGTFVGIMISLALIGVVVGGATNWPASLSIEYWGRANFSKGYGIIQPLIQLVGAIGPAFFAITAGIFGSYTFSYASGAVLMLIGLIGFLALTDPKFVQKEEAKLLEKKVI